MFNKISTKTLVILFAVLLLVVAYLLFFKSGEERSFRNELVNIDTSKVGEIHIYPRDKKHEIYLTRDGVNWNIKLTENKTAPALKSKITNLLNELTRIKPTVLAARDQSKWKEFQVDSSGTRIKVFENGKPSLDIVIGRIAFQQPNSVSTYVRLNNDVDVYKTDGYLGMMIGRSPNDFRNPNIISSNRTDWTRLTFRYPADSSFILIKDGNKWKINGIDIDSAKTVQLLGSLEHVTSENFADNFNPGDFQKPVYRITIDKKDTTSINVDAYMDSLRVIIHSSENPESYFTGTKDLNARLFLSPKRFVIKK